MKATCKKCGKLFHSVIVSEREAFLEIFALSGKHIQNKHPEMFQVAQYAIAKALEALTTVAHFEEFINVPEDEEAINKRLDDYQVIAMYALGFDPKEIEGDDDEDDDDDEKGDDDEETVDSPIILDPLPDEEGAKEPNEPKQLDAIAS